MSATKMWPMNCSL